MHQNSCCSWSVWISFKLLMSNVTSTTLYFHDGSDHFVIYFYRYIYLLYIIYLLRYLHYSHLKQKCCKNNFLSQIASKLHKKYNKTAGNILNYSCKPYSKNIVLVFDSVWGCFLTWLCCFLSLLFYCRNHFAFIYILFGWYFVWLKDEPISQDVPRWCEIFV